MPYTPSVLSLAAWTSPVTILGSDNVAQLDEAINQIISLDNASLKNHANTELGKLPAYLSGELTAIHDSVTSSVAASAIAAADSAAAALASQNAAASSASAASTSATNAGNSATAAAASASAASTSATNAATSASAASTSETNAAGSAATAAAHLASIEAIYDNFDDRYLGAKASDPTLDNDGNPLLVGAIYYNTTLQHTKFYNGTAWEDPELTSTQAASAASTSATNAAASESAAAGSASAAATSASNASTSETNAANSASAASTSATNAGNSATAAAGSASSASTSATNAANSASSASTSATNASNSASAAAGSASAAASSASAAATAETNAAATYDLFDDRFLGAKALVPSTDNDGDPLQTGALYWNTTNNTLFVWTGADWNQAAFSVSDSAAQLLSLLLTVDGAGSGLDADTVDGTQGSDLLNRNSEIETNLDTKYDTDVFAWQDTTTGRPESWGMGMSIVSNGTTYNGTNNWITQMGFGTSGNQAYFRTRVNSGAWGAWHKVWNSGNDGSGSGLDADLLDGYNTGMATTAANTVPVRDGSGDIHARLFRSTYGEQTSIPSSTADMAFRNSTTDNYIRFVTQSSARAWMGVRAFVNFSGTTNGIRNDYGVSSISDYGTGYWGVNMSVGMPDSNATAIVGDYYGTTVQDARESTPCVVSVSTTQIQIKNRYVWTNNGLSLYDATMVFLAVFR